MSYNTDTYIYVFPLALALSVIINKGENVRKGVPESWTTSTGGMRKEREM
jgi:hypothetical protein